MQSCVLGFGFDGASVMSGNKADTEEDIPPLFKSAS